MPRQPYLAVLSANFDRVRIVERRAKQRRPKQRARDVLADIVRVHLRPNLDQIGNADDADQSSDSLLGGFFLEVNQLRRSS